MRYVRHVRHVASVDVRRKNQRARVYNVDVRQRTATFGTVRSVNGV